MKKSPKEYYYWWYERNFGWFEGIVVPWDMLSEDEQQSWTEAAEEEG